MHRLKQMPRSRVSNPVPESALPARHEQRKRRHVGQHTVGLPQSANLSVFAVHKQMMSLLDHTTAWRAQGCRAAQICHLVDRHVAIRGDGPLVHSPWQQ